MNIPGELISLVEQVDDEIEGRDTPRYNIFVVVDADANIQQLLSIYLIVLHQVY